MTTWTGASNLSPPLSYQSGWTVRSAAGRLREVAARPGPRLRAGTVIIVLHPATRARNALVKGGSSLTVTITSIAGALVPAVIGALIAAGGLPVQGTPE